MTIRSCLLLAVVVLLPAWLLAQPFPPPLPEPVNGTAPLLYVRILGPAGLEATLYRGSEKGSPFPTPVTVGLRPGYVYRLELTNLPDRPGFSLFPSIEVIGTLRLPPRIQSRKYPAPLYLTEEDIDVALRGGMVTKVVYLEHPEKAIPEQSDPNNPSETTIPASRNALEEAREIGRPVMIVRLGGREMTPEELEAQAVPGTVLLPGETTLPWPRRPPSLAPVTWLWYDPLLGPRHPEEEYLHNGGLNPNRDTGTGQGMAPGLDHQGQLQGLHAEDAVAEYTTQAGQRHLVVSNRVCLIVPRFAALRQEIPLGGYESVTGLIHRGSTYGLDVTHGRLPLLAATGREMLSGLHSRSRPSGQSATIGLLRQVSFQALAGDKIYLGLGEALGTQAFLRLTEVERTRLTRQVELARALSQSEHVSSFQDVIGTSIVAHVVGTAEVVRATVEPREVMSICLKEPPHTPDKPLVLIKWADREAAQVGDVVTFFLRYSAQGSLPLSDVAITDSLSTRLEYVTGSAQSNRPAVFTLQENEAGSQVLRWEISGKLQPGESGVVRFEARVR